MFYPLMQLELIGPHPLARDAEGRQLSRIGTLFVAQSVLYTQPPGVHSWQRVSFIDHLNAQRANKGLSPLTQEDELAVSLEAVDLVFEPDHLLIRPDPERMDLAFAADELLQGLVSKRKIRFLSVRDLRVRDAIKRRGECWRLSGVPKDPEAKRSLILDSRVAIHGLPIYFYNRLTGTRWLTFKEFENLGRLDDAALAAHLKEIAESSACRNRLGLPEVDFFAADLRQFGMETLAGVSYANLEPAQLRAKYDALKAQFGSAVHEAFRNDDVNSRAWCGRMLFTLFLEGNDTQAEQILGDLSPEFFLRVDWLAGGRFEEGEFLLDPVFEEAASHSDDKALQQLCDPRAKEIIFNIIRDYRDVEYINLGCLRESLSLDRPQTQGRRGVYLVEFRASDEPEPIRRFVRLQKWDVWEHLDEGKDLLDAIQQSDEYTDYWLDRRLGCRQLGMNLCRRVFMRRLTERYVGLNLRYRGKLIRTTYFERDYLPGIATDKVPVDRFAQPGFSQRFASLLGRAAVSNLIVGRSFDSAGAAFDDGDEVLREVDGLPSEILVGDHSGAFTAYERPLSQFVAEYARPINLRDEMVPNPREFATAYLEAFRERFTQIQGDYRKRRKAFHNLFSHRTYDPAGSFAYRWERVLLRLDQTDPQDLVEILRQNIHVFKTSGV